MKGLTEKQKKLPMGLQKAILAKQKKSTSKPKMPPKPKMMPKKKLMYKK